MGLKVRIIPCLDVDAGRVVKGTKFKNLRDAGDPVELAALYDREGADEVSVNSAAVRTPELINGGAERFGSQCVVLSVDVKRKEKGRLGWEVYLNGGRLNTGMDVVAWLVEGERRGAGEFVLNSMDADGTESGYDLDLISDVASKTGLPIVASGGAGHPDHMIAAVQAGASAVLAASIFHFNEYSIAEVKERLAAAGVPVR